MEQGMNGASSARGHGRGRCWLGAAPRELLRAKSCLGAQVRMRMSHPDVSELLLAAFSRESPHGHAAAPAVSPAVRVWGAPAALSVRCQPRVVPWEGPKWEKTQGLDLKPGVSPHSGGAGNGVPSPGDSRTLPGTVPVLAQQCQALAGIYPGINLAAGAALDSIPHPGASPFPADRGDSQWQGCGSSGSAPEPLRNCSEAHLPLISSAITIKRSPHPPALPAAFPGISGKDD